jgi:hypothetical protein
MRKCFLKHNEKMFLKAYEKMILKTNAFSPYTNQCNAIDATQINTNLDATQINTNLDTTKIYVQCEY